MKIKTAASIFEMLFEGREFSKMLAAANYWRENPLSILFHHFFALHASVHQVQNTVAVLCIRF